MKGLGKEDKDADDAEGFDFDFVLGNSESWLVVDVDALLAEKTLDLCLIPCSSAM